MKEQKETNILSSVSAQESFRPYYINCVIMEVAYM